MKRAFTISALCVALALSAGCKKKDGEGGDKKADTAEKKAAEGEAKGGDTKAAAGGDTKAAAGGDTKAAAGGGGAAGDLTIEQACDKAIATMTAMASAIEGSKGDCDAMGAALEKWAADSREFLTWAKAQDKDEAKKQALQEACESKMDAQMEKIGGAMMGAMACAEHPKVQAALESLED